MRGLANRAAPVVAILAIAASGAVWAGCGGSNDSVSSEANSVIDEAQEKGNEAIDRAQKQLNEADVPAKVQGKVDQANKKLEEAQGKVNEASKQAKEQLENSGY